jgi:hypothetical protein
VLHLWKELTSNRINPLTKSVLCVQDNNNA